jgi:dihydroneopterin aldolase
MPRPLVLHLPHAAMTGPQGAAWRDAVDATGRPAVLCLDPASPRPAAATEGQRRIGLLAIEQEAWALADADPRFGVVAARTELVHALRTGELSIWAPSPMLAAARGDALPDASEPAALAAWLAREIGADTLVTIGDARPALAGAGLRLLTLPADRPDAIATLD